MEQDRLARHSSVAILQTLKYALGALLAICAATSCVTPPPEPSWGFSDDTPTSPADASMARQTTEIGSLRATTPSTPATATTSAEDPLLKPGLLVSITVLSGGKKEVDEPGKRVSSGGTVTLPLVGAIKVEGMTLDGLSDLLATRYREYLREPTIDVALLVDKDDGGLFPWGYVTILGRVMSPGRVSIPPTQDLSLSMAIQLAGGFDTSARDTGIRVTRRLDNGKKLQFDVDLRDVGAKGIAVDDLNLYSGDIVYVPERVF